MSARLLRGALAALVGLWLLPAAHAADRDVRIGLPKKEALRLKVPEGWEERIARRTPDAQPIIVITPAKGRDFRIVLTPVWPQRPEEKLPDAATIKAMMESGAAAARAEAADADMPLREVKGSQAQGSYFSATARDPKPEDFRNITQGLVRLGDIVVGFRVHSNGERATVLEPALKMIRSMRYG